LATKCQAEKSVLSDDNDSKCEGQLQEQKVLISNQSKEVNQVYNSECEGEKKALSNAKDVEKEEAIAALKTQTNAMFKQ